MKRLGKTIFLVICAAAIAVLMSATALAADDSELKVLELVNAERSAYGLEPLTWSNDAYAAAQIRANEVLQSFSHTRPNGGQFSSVFSEVGLKYAFAAENIAYGYTSPEAVVKAWMDSPGHRANILSERVKYIGIARASGSGYSPSWVQEFFTPSGAYTPSESPTTDKPATATVPETPVKPVTPITPETPITPVTPSAPAQPTNPSCIVTLIPPSSPNAPTPMTARYQPPEWD